VRLCVSAAEALPPSILERWRERFGVEILDGIGSTELLHIFCSNVSGDLRPGTSGRPVPGYDLRLIDADGAVVEGEGEGALEVRGDSCAPLYWHHHEKTKQCMRGYWCLTGDRYRREADGTYAYEGRMDDMLKVGGLWVSPVALENVIISHPDIADVGVIGVTVDDASRIAAFVITSGRAGSDELADELRELCRSRLRRYEYPHRVHFVDDLPRTLTGKVQRFRLRELAGRM
jgi:benzoate-CoA ligase